MDCPLCPLPLCAVPGWRVADLNLGGIGCPSPGGSGRAGLELPERDYKSWIGLGRRPLRAPDSRTQGTIPSSSNAHVIPDIRDPIASPVPRLPCHEPRYGSTVTLATLEPVADTPRGKPPRPDLVRRWTADDSGLPSVICGLAGGVMSRVDKGPHPAAWSMGFIRTLSGDMGALQHRDELNTSSRH